MTPFPFFQVEDSWQVVQSIGIFTPKESNTYKKPCVQPTAPKLLGIIRVTSKEVGFSLMHVQKRQESVMSTVLGLRWVVGLGSCWDAGRWFGWR